MNEIKVSEIERIEYQFRLLVSEIFYIVSKLKDEIEIISGHIKVLNEIVKRSIKDEEMQ